MELSCIVLAAGKGKRMNSEIPKVLHRVAGRPMLLHVLRIPFKLGASPIAVVLGHNGDKVESYLQTLNNKVELVWQDQLLGTGDAVKRALPAVYGKSENVLILCGDTPLLTYETIEHLVESHFERRPSCTILTAEIENPFGYGRIIRDADGFVEGIVEEADATEEEKKVKEVNSGVYVFNIEELQEGLKQLNAENNQKEYYLTKVIDYLVEKGKRVDAVKALDPNEIKGVNSRFELYEANRLFYLRKARLLMDEGVTILDPESTYIEVDVEIGKDTVIYPNTFIRGSTRIGKNCEIGPNADITDCVIGDEVSFRYSVAVESEIGNSAVVGPFAYMRPGTRIGSKSKVGTFVELKKTVVGDGSKVPHLSYIGDAEVGSGVNVGAGTITCNYDGVVKHRTVIEDDAFIGSDTIIVAPVRIGKGSYTAAGSVITEDVPPYGLGIGRSKQINKENWVIKKGLKKEDK
jgi:bifunctional UDP-N-acetylglucosamine pyrophosphorylase/glucosamine-1-phosphate N-acetyltransferase